MLKYCAVKMGVREGALIRLVLFEDLDELFDDWVVNGFEGVDERLLLADGVELFWLGWEGKNPLNGELDCVNRD